MASSPAEYELLDFGSGRKLERFGPIVLDRPAPAAANSRQLDERAWQAADARFERRSANEGHWQATGKLPPPWSITLATLRFELKLTDFGHVGLFPEQAVNWDWIARQTRSAGRALKILNLFGYTAGSTLAAAQAGAEVVHVDAARNVLGWARRNAAASGLATAPIRWIAEDARKFVARELKRRNAYDAVILDPPTYGHGPKGERWQIEQHLPELLRNSFALTQGRRAFILLTCHSSQIEIREIKSLLQAAAGVTGGHLAADALVLPAASGRELPSGFVGRWTEE